MLLYVVHESINTLMKILIRTIRTHNWWYKPEGSISFYSADIFNQSLCLNVFFQINGILLIIYSLILI